MLITPVSAPELDAFFLFLSDHLADNGSELTGYFQPLPRALSGFPHEKEAAFRQGLEIPVGMPGWRRVWVARDEAGEIRGHVDLRGHSLQFTNHRCLLGMGVHRDYRKQGIATALLAHATDWASAVVVLEWIDLQVLATNTPAIALYRKAGFVQTGDIPDMFRIDGFSIGDITMSLQLRSQRDRQGVLEE